MGRLHGSCWDVVQIEQVTSFEVVSEESQVINECRGSGMSARVWVMSQSPGQQALVDDQTGNKKSRYHIQQSQG